MLNGYLYPGIGEPFEAILSIAKGNDIERLITKVLTPLCGVETLIRPKATVVILERTKSERKG